MCVPISEKHMTRGLIGITVRVGGELRNRLTKNLTAAIPTHLHAAIWMIDTAFVAILFKCPCPVDCPIRRKVVNRYFIVSLVFNWGLLVIIHLPQDPSGRFLDYLKRTFVAPNALVSNIRPIHKIHNFFKRYNPISTRRCGKDEQRKQSENTKFLHRFSLCVFFKVPSAPHSRTPKQHGDGQAVGGG